MDYYERRRRFWLKFIVASLLLYYFLPGLFWIGVACVVGVVLLMAAGMNNDGD